jgi:peptidoglycan-N-acetylglucosamine deacetylase
MINALCVDLEPWYTAEFVKQFVPDLNEEINDQIVESVTPILNLLDKYKTTATFAVLGIIAERHPQLVKNIFEKNHEIACHAYSHKTLYELGEVGFEQEIEKSIAILKSITGSKPIGFRAPSFSLNNTTRWALNVLKKYGFKYDASIFPFKTSLYGVSKAPLYPYKLSEKDISQEDFEGDIIEFPMTVLKMVVNIPVAGGFYFRLLPLNFLKWAIKKINRTRPAIIYIHPWETYMQTPIPQNMPWQNKFITYFARNTSLLKFEELLKTFEFAPIRNVIKLSELPEENRKYLVGSK